MMRNENSFSVAAIKRIDMVAYLSGIGFKPTTIKGNDHWYLSPLRQELTASFKVNRNLNRWFDHGLGKGGNLIDFGILYFRCSVKEFVQKIYSDSSLHQQKLAPSFIAQPDIKIIVLNDSCICSYGLIKYLSARKIIASVAERFCREVRFQLNGKIYYAIGFKNDVGGYELRNRFLKLSSSPKGITTIKNGSEILCVFEGFFDFLSFHSLYEQDFFKVDFLVLNSMSFLEKSLSFIERYKAVKLYLDRDTTGQNCSRMLTDRSMIYSDESPLYSGFKDINDWLVKNHGDSS